MTYHRRGGTARERTGTHDGEPTTAGSAHASAWMRVVTSHSLAWTRVVTSHSLAWPRVGTIHALWTRVDAIHALAWTSVPIGVVH